MLSPIRSKRMGPLNWWHSLIISLLGAVFVGAIMHYAWPQTYSATSAVLYSVRPDVVAELSGDAAAGAAGRRTTNERLASILASNTLRQKLVQKHDLATKLEVDAAEAAEYLAENTEFGQVGGGFTVTVTCRGYNAPVLAIRYPLKAEKARQLCADLANSYIGELRSLVIDKDLEEAEAHLSFVKKSHTDINERLQAIEARLQTLQTQFELMDPDAKSIRVMDSLQRLETAYAESEAAVTGSAQALRNAEGQLSGVDRMRIASEVETRNPMIAQHEQRLAELRMELAREEALGKTRANRDVEQIVVAIEATEKQLAQLQQRIKTDIARQSNPHFDRVLGQVADLRVELAGARARREKHAQLLNRARGEMAQLPPVAREYVELRREQQVQSQLVISLSHSLAVARLDEARSKEGPRFTVLDEAVPPVAHLGRQVYIAALIAFISLIASLGMVMLNRTMFGRG